MLLESNYKEVLARIHKQKCVHTIWTNRESAKRKTQHLGGLTDLMAYIHKEAG